MEKIVTFGLRSVFNKNYSFKLEVDIKRGVSSYSFSVVDENGLETDIMNSHGGGLIVTISFLLQVLLLCVLKPNRRRFMVLDEPFGMLSEEYRSSMSTLIKTLCDKLSLQVLMISHSMEFEDAADIVYNFSLKGNKTVIKERGKNELDTEEEVIVDG